MNSVQFRNLLFVISICSFQNLLQMFVGLLKVSFLRLELSHLLPETQSTTLIFVKFICDLNNTY